MKDKLRLAFEKASLGYSPDRVVADPDLRKTFLAECRALGLTGTEATLLRSLLNLRKQGGLRGRKSRRTSLPDEDHYRFAAEMAARFIERRDGISLDAIICDPELAADFDCVANRLSPGYSSLQYRWAALNLRKRRSLKPELLSRVVKADAVSRFDFATIDLNRVSTRAGLYVFLTADRCLYVGEAENLQNRIRKHLDHSDNKGFARWLWEQETPNLVLETHVLPNAVPTRIRRALESEMIESRNPVFNVKR
ncbi:MAG: GIY-YIG nuclease family protein [Planctomycetes bacterium]|nr:GIY-YIG nuclease family protein [Planctomycetota bacterium]